MRFLIILISLLVSAASAMAAGESQSTLAIRRPVNGAGDVPWIREAFEVNRQVRQHIEEGHKAAKKPKATVNPPENHSLCHSLLTVITGNLDLSRGAQTQSEETRPLPSLSLDQLRIFTPNEFRDRRSDEQPHERLNALRDRAKDMHRIEFDAILAYLRRIGAYRIADLETTLARKLPRTQNGQSSPALFDLITTAKEALMLAEFVEQKEEYWIEQHWQNPYSVWEQIVGTIATQWDLTDVDDSRVATLFKLIFDRLKRHPSRSYKVLMILTGSRNWERFLSIDRSLVLLIQMIENFKITSDFYKHYTPGNGSGSMDYLLLVKRAVDEAVLAKLSMKDAKSVPLIRDLCHAAAKFFDERYYPELKIHYDRADSILGQLSPANAAIQSLENLFASYWHDPQKPATALEDLNLAYLGLSDEELLRIAFMRLETLYEREVYDLKQLREDVSRRVKNLTRNWNEERLSREYWGRMTPHKAFHKGR